MSAAAANSSSGLEVLLSTLQVLLAACISHQSIVHFKCTYAFSDTIFKVVLSPADPQTLIHKPLHENAGDIESTLNILNVLDELLSAGSDRRIHYMITKGGSQALLTALVKTARCFNPNYTVLLPLLHLLAKLGCRDPRIGMKAEDADAVLLTLNLLKQNPTHAKISAACLMVIRVYCSSVSAANLLGEHRGLDAVYRLIPPHTSRHYTPIKYVAWPRSPPPYALHGSCSALCLIAVMYVG
ncbi:unnamed protein product [Arctogadus glacialis]